MRAALNNDFTVFLLLLRCNFLSFSKRFSKSIFLFWSVDQALRYSVILLNGLVSVLRLDSRTERHASNSISLVQQGPKLSFSNHRVFQSRLVHH